MPDRVDTLINVLHVAEELAGELSNLSHSFQQDYEDSARNNNDKTNKSEDKATARRYKKDAEIFCKLAHDLGRLRNKTVRKLEW